MFHWLLVSLFALGSGTGFQPDGRIWVPAMTAVEPPTDDASWISGECDRSGRVMTCHFVQVLLYPAKTEEQYKEELAKASETWEKAKGEVASSTLGVCTKLGEVDEIVQKRENESAHLRLMAEKFYRMKALCAEPTLERWLDLLAAEYAVESKTCNAYSSTFSKSFKLQASGNWVSNTGPEKLCGRVEVATLENIDELLWRYNLKVIYTDKTSPLCEGVKDWHGVWASHEKTKGGFLNLQTRPLQCIAIRFSGVGPLLAN